MARAVAATVAVAAVTVAGSAAYVPLGGDADTRPVDTPAAQPADDTAPAAKLVHDATAPARLANAIDGYGLTPVPSNVYTLHQRLVRTSGNPDGDQDFVDDLELASADARAWAARNDAVLFVTNPPNTDIRNTNIVVHRLHRTLDDAALCLGQHMSGACDDTGEGLLAIENRLDMFGHDNTSDPDVAEPLRPATPQQAVGAYRRLYAMVEDLLGDPVADVIVDRMDQSTNEPLDHDPLSQVGGALEDAHRALLDRVHTAADGDPHVALLIEAINAQRDLLEITDRCGSLPTGRWCEALPYWRQHVIECIDRAQETAP